MIQIRSIGIVSAQGRGPGQHESALKGSEIAPPREVELAGSGRTIPAFTLLPETLTDREVLKGMRRADRLSKMSVMAAFDAFSQNKVKELNPERTGVLLATGLGPHVRTFKFLDGILDFGHASVSPTDFSHSVHNTAAGYITKRLAIHGPVQTLTDFDFAFPNILRIAENWLSEDRCDAVLAGAAEEIGDVMLNISAMMALIPEHGRLQPLCFSDNPAVVPGEGAVFFLLTAPEYSNKNPGVFIDTCLGADTEADILILDAEGMSGPESSYADMAGSCRPVGNYLPLFGSMMTGIAFQSAVAYMMALRDRPYRMPSPGFEGDFAVFRPENYKGAAGAVNCLKRSRNGRWQTVRIKKSH